jgi:hypothetical protein
MHDRAMGIQWRLALGPRAWGAFATIAAVAAAIALAIVWAPLLLHYHVPAATPLATAVLDEHRRAPSDAVLTIVADASMMTDHPLEGAAVVAAARGILNGELALPNLPPTHVACDFDSRTLDDGPPVVQLWTASLIVVDLLLRAHETVPEPRFLDCARRYVRTFVRWESTQRWPRGLVWSQHPLVNRVAVLARFWRTVRQEPDADAAAVHAHLRRVGAMLANPSMYVANTNYGVMENVALLQIAAAFPRLPEAEGWRALALGRMLAQLPTYMADDGVILEHSAGYQFHGVLLLGYARNVLRASGQPVPRAIDVAYESALAVLTTMERPDGTLPPLGNTYRYRWRLPAVLGPDGGPLGARAAARDSRSDVYAAGGLWIAWNRESAAGVATQSVVPWALFPDNGHRRAHDLSLLIWADGMDWSTNSGYWPGADPAGAERAAGWDGGNAPHVQGEPPFAPREDRLLAFHDEPDLRVADFVRSSPGGPTVRRQIVELRGSQWVVLDTWSDPSNRPLRTLWTAAPETRLRTLGDRRYRWDAPGARVSLSLALAGPAVSSAPLTGSREPFGGWVAFDRAVHPAPAVDVRSQHGAWVGTALTLEPANADVVSPANSASMATNAPSPLTGEVHDAEHWRLALNEGGAIAIHRDGAQLTVESEGQSRRVTLAAGADGSAVRRHQATAIASLRSAYPRFRDAVEERRDRSALIVALLGLALVVAMLARRELRRRQSPD